MRLFCLHKHCVELNSCSNNWSCDINMSVGLNSFICRMRCCFNSGYYSICIRYVSNYRPYCMSKLCGKRPYNQKVSQKKCFT